MKQITSFTVDHDTIIPGFYISRIDGDVITFDLRTRIPNAGDYMDNLTMHSVEHMMATLLRNSEASERVIYFGPMGCQTGFYLLMRNTSPSDAFALTCRCLADAIAYMGEMPGNKRKECGNYQNLDMNAAKRECKRYLDALINCEKFSERKDFSYE
ncbi:MAG: S-ribosylhomocysteine lyase [Clostridia bacterium]|nr:S-ribosylhomocysteine lyase [Clostridia bacterium]